jgi:hypothetical protein
MAMKRGWVRMTWVVRRKFAAGNIGAFSRFDDASVFNQTLLSTVGAART